MPVLESGWFENFQIFQFIIDLVPGIEG